MHWPFLDAVHGQYERANMKDDHPSFMFSHGRPTTTAFMGGLRFRTLKQRPTKSISDLALPGVILSPQIDIPSRVTTNMQELFKAIMVEA